MKKGERRVGRCHGRSYPANALPANQLFEVSLISLNSSLISLHRHRRGFGMPGGIGMRSRVGGEGTSGTNKMKLLCGLTDRPCMVASLKWRRCVGRMALA
jgi:hypothetical protein